MKRIFYQYFLIMISIISFIVSLPITINYFYEIKITVKGIGNQMILSNQSAEYNGRILKFSYIPNEILITLPHINILLGIDEENI